LKYRVVTRSALVCEQSAPAAALATHRGYY
jgi:hypothetical protein